MTDFAVLSQDALRLARARHLAILADDFEQYDALSEPLAEACAALEAAPGAPPDRGIWNELSALETGSLRALEAQAAEVSGRLEDLASRSRTSRAYARSERTSVNRL